MRSFVSLDLPDPCRDPLLSMVAGLRCGRGVPWDNLHLTLAFLGDQPEETLEDLHAALEPLHLSAPCVRFGGLDGFGPARARLLAALVDPVPELMALQAAVERAARRVGIRPERRAYRPHVTLVRFRRAMPPAEATMLGTFLADPPTVDIAPRRATSFSLQGSTLRPDGARYEALATYPLL